MVSSKPQRPFKCYYVLHFIWKVSFCPNDHFFSFFLFLPFVRCERVWRQFEFLFLGGLRRIAAGDRVDIVFETINIRRNTFNHNLNQTEKRKKMNELFNVQCSNRQVEDNLNFRWFRNNCRRNGSMMNFLNESKKKPERFYYY